MAGVGRGAKDTASGGAAGSKAAWALGQFSSGKWWNSSREGIEKLTGQYLFTGTFAARHKPGSSWSDSAHGAWWDVVSCAAAAALGVSAPRLFGSV